MTNKCTNYTPKEAKEYMESLAEKYRNKIFEYKKAK